MAPCSCKNNQKICFQHNQICLQPKDKGRYVLVVDRGHNHCFNLWSDLTPNQVSNYVDKNPSVLAWLPANSYGNITIHKNADRPNGKASWIFDFEARNCSSLFQNGDGNHMEGAEVPWFVECPPDSGTIVFKLCPEGKKAVCEGPSGNVNCE